MNVVTTHSSNNFGYWQHDEKLIPTVIRKALAGEVIPIYGTGTNVRDWLWVGDHCRAIDAVFHHAGAVSPTTSAAATNGRTGNRNANLPHLGRCQTASERSVRISDRVGGRQAGTRFPVCGGLPKNSR